jgi:hypothetical protein
MTRQIAVPEIPTDTATSHAPRVVHRLLDAGYRLPDELRDDILALGQAAVPALLEIVEDAVSKSPVGGWAPEFLPPRSHEVGSRVGPRRGRADE